jgi:hypothetical protein
MFGGGAGFLAAAIIFYRVFQNRKTAPANFVCLKIRPFKNSERNPIVFEHVFSAIHSATQKNLKSKNAPKFLFEIATVGGKIHFFVRCEKKFSEFVKQQIYAQNPQVEIEQIIDYAKVLRRKNWQISAAEIQFSSADLWPVKRISQFEDRVGKVVSDPIAGICEALSGIEKTAAAAVQIILQPNESRKFRARSEKLLQILNGGFLENSPQSRKFFEKIFVRPNFKNFPARIFFHFWRKFWPGNSTKNLEIEMKTSHDRETRVAAAADKISRLFFDASIRTIFTAPEISMKATFANVARGNKNVARGNEIVRENSDVDRENSDVDRENKFAQKNNENKTENAAAKIAGVFRQFALPQSNSLKIAKVETGGKIWEKFVAGNSNREIILTTEELATLFHMPNATVRAPKIDWVLCQKLEPPANLPTNESPENAIPLGRTNFRGEKKIFSIRTDDRRRHVYIVGKTGMGKSTFLENMIFADVNSNRGVAVVDPHGDLADAVLNFVPRSRTNDVILFDPSDREFPISFNLLECPNPENRNLVASGIVGIFKKLFAESWGPRLEYILRNVILSLIEAPGATILGIPRILTDEKFRAKILKSVADPVVSNF